MRAARLTGPRRIAVAAVRRPVPGRGEALVRVRAVGVCRSDLHYWLHGRIGNQVIRRWPQTLGHEPAGVVTALGPGVRNLKPGDRVAIEPAVPCGRCAECRAGRGNVCGRVRFLGMPGQPGALAEFLAHPAACLVRVPRSVGDEEAAALEPLAIGLHAVRLLHGRPLARALVVGAGPVGLCILAALRLRRARVTACDPVPARLAVARRMGAARAVRVDARAPARRTARALGGPFDAVFEAAGTAAAVELALRAARPGGTVALAGIPDGDTIPYHAHLARRKELVIVNVRRSNGELREAVRLVAAGRVRLGPLLTHRGGLDDAGRLFALVHRRGDGVVKAVIHP